MSERQEAIDALNRAFTFKYHSLAGYIEQADPYVAAGLEVAMNDVRAIAAEDRIEADRLARRLESLEGIPQAGSATLDAASVNYLAIDYLLGVLLKDLERQVAFYEDQLERFEGPVRDDFERLLAAARRHADKIRSLIKPGPAGGSA